MRDPVQVQEGGIMPTKKSRYRSSINYVAATSAWIFTCILANSSRASEDLTYLDLSLEQLLEVPVTGSTLTEESLKTVPASVSVFTHEQISRLGVDYLYELLNLVPGFQFDRNSSSGVAYTYSARGRRSSQQSLEVLLLIDGHVVNDPRAGSPDITLPLYPLAQVERLEVIRGPGSAIYGSSAFNGVINIVTRKQQKSIALAYGSQQRRQLESLWSGVLDSWAVDGFIHAFKDNGDDFVLQDSFNRQPIATRDPRQQFAANLALAREKTRIALSYSRTETGDFYQSDNTGNDYNANDRTLWHLALDQDFEWLANTRSTLALSYQQFTYDFNLFLAGPGQLAAVSRPSSAEPFKGDARLAGESWHITFSNDWAINTDASAQWGLQLARNEETDASAVGNFDLEQLIQRRFPIAYYGDQGKTFPLGNEGSQDNIGIYAQYLRNLRATTRLTLGGRYDEYPDITGRFSPRLGLVEQLNDTYSLKLLYGEAFRAPTLTETGLMNNPVLLGNPDLTHEIVKTWDLIVMGNWNTTSLSAGLFQNRYEKPIETVFTSTGRTYGNGNREQSQGIELEWLQEISSHWSVRTTYTRMDLPDSAAREAEQLASLEVNYATGRWNWNLMGFYQDQRNNPVTDSTWTKLDDFWVLNTRLRYEINPGCDLALTVKNLTNSDYSTPSQSLGKPQGIPNRGRELNAAIEWKF
ncbi:TonB-dependent siderophore receptor [Cellvibrio sp. pealriver]|uniref:TonB-dependent receptor plug domain-containing protein n=1 Tax=Cellvibrio sp. pealriver TaxID=1622269 RepID=UPI0009E25503|nr:TonB-dependent receptor [Cellvibrio sp. pealriver]